MCPFEKFAETSKFSRPRASIRRVGQIGLNKGAVTRFGVSEYSHAVLYYDRERQVVGIEMTNEGEIPGAAKITIRSGSASIAAKSFLNYFGINYSQKVLSDLEKTEFEGRQLLMFSAVPSTKGRGRKN